MSNPEESPTPIASWNTRTASGRDMEGILKCRAATFAGEEPEKEKPAYWKWEFLENHAGPARLFVAADGDRIVGHYAVVPQRFVLDGKILQGSIVVDVMTHPDYRVQGMFTRLGRFSLEQCAAAGDIEFTTGYPIRPEVIPGHLKVGWKIRFKIGTWIMPLAAGTVLAGQFPRLQALSWLQEVIGFLPSLGFRAWSRLAVGSPRRSVTRMAACDHGLFAAFWDEFLREIPARCVVQERTPAYLAWRFDANPGRHYTYHAAMTGDGRLSGFAVSRVARLLNVDAMILVDACVLPGETGVVRALVSDVRALALRQGCAMLATMVTQPNPIVGNPARLGFVPTPYRFSFITKELSKRKAIADDHLRWHLMWGDTDDV